MNELTPRQQEVFTAIADIIRQGRTPLTAELLQLLGFRQTSGLTNALKPLVQKGFLRVEGGVRGRQRIIALTDKGRAGAQMGFPVLGRIPAGPLLLAESEVTEWIEPGTTLRAQPGDFFLCVAGDSMIGDGILDGDRVLIRPNVLVNNGEIAAVAQVQGDASGEHLATLKRVFHSPGKKSVRLKASNPLYEDLVLPANRVRIVGAYRGLFRRSDN